MRYQRGDVVIGKEGRRRVVQVHGNCELALVLVGLGKKYDCSLVRLDAL